MGDISKNFNRSEFACKCDCGDSRINPRLVASLQTLRDQVGKPINVNSGVRCHAHNRREGGKKKSFHLIGRAADIWVAGMSTAELFEIAKTIPGLKGFGFYSTFLHVDNRSKYSTWNG